jgi:hypothetical protein
VSSKIPIARIARGTRPFGVRLPDRNHARLPALAAAPIVAGIEVPVMSPP